MNKLDMTWELQDSYTKDKLAAISYKKFNRSFTTITSAQMKLLYDNQNLITDWLLHKKVSDIPKQELERILKDVYEYWIVKFKLKNWQKLLLTIK